MKIIKSGNGKCIYKRWRFKCEVCGCEFMATLSECLQDYDMRKPAVYACECPECQSYAFNGVEVTGKPEPEGGANGEG